MKVEDWLNLDHNKLAESMREEDMMPELSTKEFENSINNFIKEQKEKAVNDVSSKAKENINKAITTKERGANMASSRFSSDNFTKLRQLIVEKCAGRIVTIPEIVEIAKSIPGVDEKLVKNKLWYIITSKKFESELSVENVHGFRISAPTKEMAKAS